MTLRQRLAHVHARLGFGATPAELDRDEKLGFDRAVDRLINYQTVDEKFPVSPYEFCWREKDDADVGSYLFRSYWALRMMATERPLQEKLTLFWHSHFAVGDGKVEDGPMMLDYLEGLRADANGKFTDLLRGASQAPAMMRYLDMTRSMRGHPNENFAREVMELFTLGIDGGYTETDVKEVSRALTGWGMIHFMYELPGTMTERLKESIRFRRPFSSFTYMPSLHDPGEKTILGKTKAWTGDEVLEFLAYQPATADRIATKLWAFFGSDKPEPAAVKRIAGTFMKTKGDIKATLRTLVNSPEFWSDQCIGQHAKSPADFVIGVARAQGIGNGLLDLRDPNATELTRLTQAVMDNAGYAAYRMDKMGLTLLNPPDVSGWKWGSAFITPATMAERYQYQGHYLPIKDKPDVGTQTVIGWVASQQPKDSRATAARICEAYGVQPTESTLTQLAKAVDNAGGIEALKSPDRWANMHSITARLLTAAPEMHVC